MASQSERVRLPAEDDLAADELGKTYAEIPLFNNLHSDGRPLVLDSKSLTDLRSKHSFQPFVMPARWTIAMAHDMLAYDPDFVVGIDRFGRTPADGVVKAAGEMGHPWPALDGRLHYAHISFRSNMICYHPNYPRAVERWIVKPLTEYFTDVLDEAGQADGSLYAIDLYSHTGKTGRVTRELFERASGGRLDVRFASLTSLTEPTEKPGVIDISEAPEYWKSPWLYASSAGVDYGNSPLRRVPIGVGGANFIRREYFNQIAVQVADLRIAQRLLAEAGRQPDPKEMRLLPGTPWPTP